MTGWEARGVFFFFVGRVYVTESLYSFRSLSVYAHFPKLIIVEVKSS